MLISFVFTQSNWRREGGGETYATNILTYAAVRIFYAYIYWFFFPYCGRSVVGCVVCVSFIIPAVVRRGLGAGRRRDGMDGWRGVHQKNRRSQYLDVEKGFGINQYGTPQRHKWWWLMEYLSLLPGGFLYGRRARAENRSPLPTQQNSTKLSARLNRECV